SGGELSGGTWRWPADEDAAVFEPGAERGIGCGGAGVSPASLGLLPLFGSGAGRPGRTRDTCATTLRRAEKGEHHGFGKAAERFRGIGFPLGRRPQPEPLGNQADELGIGAAAGMTI